MIRMKKFLMILTAALPMLLPLSASAQTGEGADVFQPIAKYIRTADAESLSAWFADNLEVTVLSSTSVASRNQAKQIVKSFFEAFAPRSFEVTSTASRGNTRHAIGTLRAGGEVFGVTILVSCKEKSYHIRQLKFEKAD